MFNIGLPELIIILVLALVVFGANRLSGLGKALGDNIRDFKAAVKEDPSETDSETAEG